MITCGAIAGDMFGSEIEFNDGIKKEYRFDNDNFGKYSDDTIMTLAIKYVLSNRILTNGRYIYFPDPKDDNEFRKRIVISLKTLGQKYPYAGYGATFYNWLFLNTDQPYNSFGNGSAMRVSSVGWKYNSIEEVKHVAQLTAEVTHNHPEGIKGAQAIALCILAGRYEIKKERLKSYIEKEFGYNLNTPLSEVKYDIDYCKSNKLNPISCQYTVPQAIIAFLESNSFEDCIFKAVNIGGDTDTIGAMAGSIAEAYYGVPDYIEKIVRDKLPEELLFIYDYDVEFNTKIFSLTDEEIINM